MENVRIFAFIIDDIKDTVEVVKVIKPIYNFKARQ